MKQSFDSFLNLLYNHILHGVDIDKRKNTRYWRVIHTLRRRLILGQSFYLTSGLLTLYLTSGLLALYLTSGLLTLFGTLGLCTLTLTQGKLDLRLGSPRIICQKYFKFLTIFCICLSQLFVIRFWNFLSL